MLLDGKQRTAASGKMSGDEFSLSSQLQTTSTIY